jgi:hypothetical protein
LVQGEWSTINEKNARPQKRKKSFQGHEIESVGVQLFTSKHLMQINDKKMFNAYTFNLRHKHQCVCVKVCLCGDGGG